MRGGGIKGEVGKEGEVDVLVMALIRMTRWSLRKGSAGHEVGGFSWWKSCAGIESPIEGAKKVILESDISGTRG